MLVVPVKNMLIGRYQRNSWLVSRMAGLEYSDMVVRLLDADNIPSSAYANRIIEFLVPAVSEFYGDPEFLDGIQESNAHTEVKKVLNHARKDPNRKYTYTWLVFPVGVLLSNVAYSSDDSKLDAEVQMLETGEGDNKMEAVNLQFKIAESGGVEVEEYTRKQSIADLRKKRTASSSLFGGGSDEDG